MNDPEKTLNILKLRKPPRQLKNNILSHSKAHWRSSKQDNSSYIDRYVKYVFAICTTCVIIMLIASSLSYNETADYPYKPTQEELSIFTDIGLSPQLAKQLLFKYKNRKNVFTTKHSLEELFNKEI